MKVNRVITINEGKPWIHANMEQEYKDKVKIVLNMILDAAVEDRLLDRNPLKSKRLKITGGAGKVTEPYTGRNALYGP